jgi:RNA polymerase sigma-70 factor (ECF subfamily)
MDAFVTLRFPSLTIQDDPRSTATVANKEVPAQAETSDESLMREVSEGSREALGLLFHRYARIVRGVAYRVLRDASEADDLLQDIFLLIHRKCGMFDAARGPARFWILQMTYHRAIARRRYLNSRHFYTRVDIVDAENDVADMTDASIGLRFSRNGLLGNSGLGKVFGTLSEDQRETLRLFFVEGYTLAEIAAKINQSLGNTKHHYFRGLEKLRKHFFDSKLRSNSAV